MCAHASIGVTTFRRSLWRSRIAYRTLAARRKRATGLYSDRCSALRPTYHARVMRAAMKRLKLTARCVIVIGVLAVPGAYAESIPLKPEGGTFVLPVLINDKITLDFTLDSGAADVSIPLDVFSTLRRTRTISDDDLLEPAVYTLADGSVQRQLRFRIRSLRVGGLELRNVVGSVAPLRGSLLLGQSFLSRLQTWSVDNQRHALVLNESFVPATPDQPTIRDTHVTAGSQSTGGKSPDYQCGAAQNLCHDGAHLCEVYREDFRRDHHYCPGVYEPAPGIPPTDNQSTDYACGAAQNLCREGADLCKVYREDFRRTHHYCAGVTTKQ